jgi:hypothetical protein
VPDAVDLDHEPPPARQPPLDVEEPPSAARIRADRLPVRLRQPAVPAQPGEVDLRERVGTADDVHDVVVPEPP